MFGFTGSFAALHAIVYSVLPTSRLLLAIHFSLSVVLNMLDLHRDGGLCAVNVLEIPGESKMITFHMISHFYAELLVDAIMCLLHFGKSFVISSLRSSRSLCACTRGTWCQLHPYTYQIK